jgi:hypothetical protein
LFHQRNAEGLGTVLIILIIVLIGITPRNNSSFANSSSTLRISYVKPTFTAAAYGYGNGNYGFYDFYHKAGTSDPTILRFLTSKISPSPIFKRDQAVFLNLTNHIKKLLPYANVSVITDQAVDNGSIFNQGNTNHPNNYNMNDYNGTGSYNNGTNNKYDVLLLGHQEYVTQSEYENLKKFVDNGGTLIILDGNVFYAEVRYDKPSQTITLVRGHGFRFDGHTVRHDVLERWENETRQWVGSNFYHFASENYHLAIFNNPFQYRVSYAEEQFISNPEDKIILDYGSSDLRYPIATYELNFGKGRVIGTGIWSEQVMGNTQFLKFFDDLLVNYAVPSDKINKLTFHVSHYEYRPNKNITIPSTNASTVEGAMKPKLIFEPWKMDEKKMDIHSVVNGSNTPIFRTNTPIFRIAWRESENPLKMQTDLNGTNNTTIFRISGQTDNRPGGFLSQILQYKGRHISLTTGLVLKYGETDRTDTFLIQESQILFIFDIKGVHNDYKVIMVHGPLSKNYAGWFNNNYYENIGSHSSVSINLDGLLASIRDKYSSIERVGIFIPMWATVNPVEFKIDFG